MFTRIKKLQRGDKFTYLTEKLLIVKNDVCNTGKIFVHTEGEGFSHENGIFTFCKQGVYLDSSCGGIKKPGKYYTTNAIVNVT